MDAIHYHVRQDGRIVKKAVYIAIGIDLEGIKDVLGLWIGGNESSKYWLSVINEMRNRGVQDVLIACVDGLSGFSEAVSAVFPNTEIQKCVIHQIRNSTRFVSYKDIKPLMVDLKRVYTAPTEETAVNELDKFDTAWGNKYPKIAISCFYILRGKNNGITKYHAQADISRIGLYPFLLDMPTERDVL